MSREIYRVPLDFDWPLKKAWPGFINPHDRPCPQENKTCFGGRAPAMEWLWSIAHLIALIGQDAAEAPRAAALRARGTLHPHPYLVEWPMAPRYESKLGITHMVPIDDPQLVDLVTGLAEGDRPDSLRGGEYTHRIVKSLLRAAGIDDEKWGLCTVCGGHCNDPASRAAMEAWTPTPPPEGPGWQLWQTTSDASPVSPVLPNREAFRKYLVDQVVWDEDDVDAFIDHGSCPTAVVEASTSSPEAQ